MALNRMPGAITVRSAPASRRTNHVWPYNAGSVEGGIPADISSIHAGHVFAYGSAPQIGSVRCGTVGHVGLRGV